MNETNKLYIPTSGGQPAILEVNGHKILLVSHDSDDLFQSLGRLNAEAVEAIAVEDHLEDTLARIETSEHVGIVVVPDGESSTEVVDSLSASLPWVH